MSHNVLHSVTPALWAPTSLLTRVAEKQPPNLSLTTSRPSPRPPRVSPLTPTRIPTPRHTARLPHRRSSQRQLLSTLRTAAGQEDHARHLKAGLPVARFGALFRLAVAGGVLADGILVEGGYAHIYFYRCWVVGLKLESFGILYLPYSFVCNFAWACVMIVWNLVSKEGSGRVYVGFEQRLFTKGFFVHGGLVFVVAKDLW